LITIGLCDCYVGRRAAKIFSATSRANARRSSSVISPIGFGGFTIASGVFGVSAMRPRYAYAATAPRCQDARLSQSLQFVGRQDPIRPATVRVAPTVVVTFEDVEPPPSFDYPIAPALVAQLNAQGTDA
jgi:hypothetical protein